METHEQKLARGLDRHLVVTANAGSGKTRALVSRYVDLVLQGVDPKEIVAITFTRKAAAEMQTRVAEELEKIASAGDSKTIARIKRIREKLTSSRISTIHSFCSTLLRDYPVEAGVDPGFSELTNADKLRIETDAVNNVMEQWLQPENESRKAKAQDLFSKFGFYFVENILKQLLNRTDIYENLKKVYSSDFKKIETVRDGYIAEMLLPPLLDGLRELLIILNSVDTSKLKKPDQDFLINLSESVNSMITKMRSGASLSQDTMFELKNELEALKESPFITKKFTINKTKLKNKLIGIDADEANERLIGLNGTSDFFNAYGNVNLDAELFGYAHTFWEMARDVITSVEDEKQELRAVDYGDMLIKARNLLDDISIRRKLRHKIKHILVDEFQDTNPLQYEIVKSLVPEMKHVRNYEHNVFLFIVGDAKQSIYGFRYADVRVFLKAANELSEINQQKLRNNELSREFTVLSEKTTARTGKEAAGQIELSATFRLLPVPAAFVNAIFDGIPEESRTEFDVNYSPLVCARSAEYLLSADEKPIINENGKTDNSEISFGSAKLLLVKEDKKNTAAETEAELLAKYIKKVVSDTDGITVQDKDGTYRHPGFGDISILARKKADLNDLASVFQKMGIPYALHAGNSFFESQEIVDIFSYLKFLHNRNDDIALAGILKSPFFGLSDAELLNISVYDGNSFYEKFLNYCADLEKDGSNGSVGKEIELYARSTLSELITLAPRLTISRLIAKIIEESGWYGAVAANPARSQMKANMDKFIQYARDFETRGFRNLYDFVEEINFLITKGADEEEAVFMPGGDAVNLMTVHAAKGLEFPIVTIYKSNFSTRNQGGTIVSPELGITFNTPDSTGDALISKETPLHYLNKKRAALADEAEEKRILYVALTRAQDHLIVSGTITNTLNGFLPLILESLGLDSVEVKKSSAVLNQSLTLDKEVGLLTDSGVQNIELSFPVEIIGSVEDTQPIETAGADDYAGVKFLLDEIPGSINKEIFSASKLTAYEDNFDEYLLKYRLGLSTLESGMKMTEFDHMANEDRETATVTGTLIHGVMERVAEWFDADGKVDEEELQRTVRRVMEQNNAPFEQEIVEQVLEECINTVSTTLIQKLSKNIIKGEPEKELIMPASDDYLVGSMDLLLKNESGEYEIWDWKTNKIDYFKRMDEHAEHYKLQLSVYAYMTALLNPSQQKITARLLFTKQAGKNAGENEWTRAFTWNREEIIARGEKLIERLSEIKNRTYFE